MEHFQIVLSSSVNNTLNVTIPSNQLFLKYLFQKVNMLSYNSFQRVVTCPDLSYFTFFFLFDFFVFISLLQFCRNILIIIVNCAT